MQHQCVNQRRVRIGLTAPTKVAPIEVSMDDISVRIGRDADATLIAAVLDALKAGR